MELVAREVSDFEWHVLALVDGGEALLGTYESRHGAIAAVKILLAGKYAGCPSFVERKGVE